MEFELIIFTEMSGIYKDFGHVLCCRSIETFPDYNKITMDFSHFPTFVSRRRGVVLIHFPLFDSTASGHMPESRDSLIDKILFLPCKPTCPKMMIKYLLEMY